MFACIMARACCAAASNSLSSRLMLSAASIISSTSDCDTGRFGVLAWMDSLALERPHPARQVTLRLAL